MPKQKIQNTKPANSSPVSGVTGVTHVASAMLSLTMRGKRLNGQRTGSIEAVVERALRRVADSDLRATERVLQTIVTELEGEKSK